MYKGYEMNRDKKKAIALSFDDKTIVMLKYLANANSSSMSHEVRRLIRNEYKQVTGNTIEM